MKNILLINGSYREDGITDQSISIIAETLTTLGAKTETIALRDSPIEFCLNCRHCTQLLGEAPGDCVIEDNMALIVQKIEKADAIVLASPTNFGSVTALFKRFMERLIIYTYWPWGKAGPIMRKNKAEKKRALIISSSGAPEMMGRWLFSTTKDLQKTAKLLGAEPIGTLFTGMISKEPHSTLPAHIKIKAEKLARLLMAS
ncbi:MAG: flavodoxin family protein [Cellvibrionaceae bacterium]